MGNNDFYDIDSVNKNSMSKHSKNDDRNKGLFVSGIIVGMAASLLIMCVVFIGVKIGGLVGANDKSNLDSIVNGKTSSINGSTLKKLQTLETTINDNFYLHETTAEELQTGMYKGMIEALDDPYSEYYTAEELNELLDDTEGIYYGIGAYVSIDIDTNFTKISGVISGAPAEEAQLRANDIIYEVDGVSTYGVSLNEVVSMIKGPEGSEVLLTIVREGELDYLEVPVTRRKVESPTVRYEMYDGGMAYIRIMEFDDVTVDQFADALASVRASGMKGLMLDLRANPGGSLSAVVDIARMLLPEGKIVYTEDKNGEQEEYTCDGSKELDVPLVVLVDMNSASAAEILSGAIQDYGIGTLVGTTTYGKGIVQQIIPFRDGSAVKLTISRYFTPNGRNIHGVGIEPDVLCEFDAESYYDAENSVDNQLEKAIEILGSLIKNR